MLRLAAGGEAGRQRRQAQPESACSVLVESVLCPENKSLSKPPKKNHLFFRIGPPMVPPLNSSLLRRGPVCGLHCGLFRSAGTVQACQVVPACWLLEIGHGIQEVVVFSAVTLPCQALDPDLVMMFTTEPALRPYSGPKWLVTITYCCTKFGVAHEKPTGRRRCCRYCSVRQFPGHCCGRADR